mgnify:FL=1
MERDLLTLTPAHDPAAMEAAVERLVRHFYVKGDADDLIGPIFRAIPALDDHLQVIIDFWSRQLIGTDRYTGRPFPPHWKLELTPEHFDRWIALFSETAREELPADLADKAIEKAGHMSTAFQAAMFPLRGPDGRPMRLPRD